MAFIKKSYDTSPVIDGVFAIVKKANEAKMQYGEKRVMDATIGSLCDEEGQLVALKSVFDSYNQIEDQIKAKYAQGFIGNENFRVAITKWVIGNSACNLPSSIIATPGGTGAVNLTIQSMLDRDETLVIPDIAWGSYKVMANNSGLNVATYEMFEGNHFNLKSFKEVCCKVIDEQHKLCVIINDPCHNPTGYSMSNDEWVAVVNFINELTQKGEVILLNDIAYIDYSYNLDECRKYMNNFNTFNANVLVVVAFSTSKTLTSYGMRCGAALIMCKDQSNLQVVEDVFAKAGRAIWSNTNNSAMENFVRVVEDNTQVFMQEKAFYISQLKKRSEQFMKEAKACGLEIYPYIEGFFVTIKIEDNAKLDQYHALLMDHLIFTVKVNKGIRVAICSLSINKTTGLAKRMKDVLAKL